MWADEVATIAGSNRPFLGILHMLQTIDAVHGTYYLFIHALGQVVGFGTIAIRVPSAVAIALTSVIVFKIVHTYFGERLAWFALVICALLPRLAWAALEARSYAIDALLGALLMWIFLLLTEPNASGRRAKWLWVAYTFTLALSMHFFVYIALYAGTQGIWLLWRRRDLFKRWMTSTLISVAVSAYLIVWVVLEKGQVGWLPPISSATAIEVFVGQAFWGDLALAFVANGLIAAVIFGAHHRSRSVSDAQHQLIQLFGLVISVPSAIVIVYSIVGGSIYDSRYFTFSAPIVAILLAIAVDQLFSKRMAFAALALIVGLSLPAYFHFRSLDAKGTHWNSVAKIIESHSQPGDGILYTDYDRKSPSQSRLKIAFPHQLRNITDLTAVTPYYKAPGLYPERESIAAAGHKFASFKRILVIQVSSEKREFATVKRILALHHFNQTSRIHLYNTWLLTFTR
jgi:mannosyltransferase